MVDIAERETKMIILSFLDASNTVAVYYKIFPACSLMKVTTNKEMKMYLINRIISNVITKFYNEICLTLMY